VSYVAKIEAANQMLMDIQGLLNQGTFDCYTDLYKYLVGFEAKEKGATSVVAEDVEETPEEQEYWRKIYELTDYIKAKEAAFENNEQEYPHLRTNIYDHWTQVELMVPERKLYRELVKLYIPVEYKDLPEIAREVFDFLLSEGHHFCYKFAHSERKDNICIWIRREQLERVVDFLETFKDKVLSAPFFCPEYRGFGVTRELGTSFNEMVASTLYRYLPEVPEPTVADYVSFLNNDAVWKERCYSEFDTQVVLRSLKCIRDKKCPTVEGDHNVADFIDEED